MDHGCMKVRDLLFGGPPGIICVGNVSQSDEGSSWCWSTVDHLVQFRWFLVAGHSLITRQKDNEHYSQNGQRDYSGLCRSSHHNFLYPPEV